MIVLALNTAPSFAALSDGLELHSTFDVNGSSTGAAAAGAIMYDFAGPPALQNGTVTNTTSPAAAITLQSGIIGQAIDFPGLGGASGTDRGVDYGSVFGIGAGEFTVSLWFNVDLNGSLNNTATLVDHDQLLISRGANATTDAGWSISAMGSTNRVRVILGPGGTGNNVQLITADNSLSTDTWYHAAVTLKKELDGTGTVTAYLNGLSDGFSVAAGFASSLASGYNIVPGNNLRVGRRNTTNTPTNGLIDDLGIWNRALSATEVMEVYNNGLMGQSLPSSLLNATEWVSTTTTDWGTSENWSLNAVPTVANELVFRGAAGTINVADLNGAARSASGLTFNGNGGTFQITGLTVANPLTLDALLNSKTAPDIKVTSGDHKIVGSGALSADPAASNSSGDLVLGGVSASDWFVVDIAAGASLDVQASISQITTTGRNTHFVKQGQGTLTFSSQTQMDLRPSATEEGGIYVNEGTLQFAAYAARGNSFASVYVAPGAMLEFKGAGYDGVFGTDGSRGNRSLLKISGNGVGGKGAIYNSAGSNVLQSGMNSSVTAGGIFGPGLIVIAGDSSIGVAAGTSLTLSHGITDFGDFTSIGGAGGSGVAGKLTKVGAGTLIFNANNNTARNGYSQEIIVNEGTLLVTSPTTSSTRLGAELFAATTITLANVGDTDGLYIGQPVTITNIVNGAPVLDSSAVIAGIGTDGRTFRVSELVTGFGAGVIADLSFGAVTSALNTSPVTVNSGGTFGGTGSVLGSTVTVNSGGAIAPGTSIGTLTVGNATIDGKLKIEFGDNAIDKLVVAGTLNIAAATVDFSALGNLANGEYIFATYDFLQGTNFLNVLNLPGSLTLHHDTTNKYFALVGSYSASLPGDFNGDGNVDAADYVLWRKNPGAFPPNAYDTWRANFGNPAGSGAAFESGAVPEPSSVICLVLGAAFVTGSRRVSRRPQLA